MEDALAQGPSWTTQLKKILDDTLNVKISTGDQFIAPQYNHDRCERSVQMRLYTMNKQNFTLVFVLFFVTFFMFLLIGLAGPPITTTKSQSVFDLPEGNSTDLTKGPFLLTTTLLSPYCQQLWVIAALTSKEKNSEALFQRSFQISVEIKRLSLNNEKSQMISDQGNRTHRLSCKGSACENLVLVHLGVLNFPKYSISVKFYGLEAFHENVEGIIFHFKSYNPAYSQLEIWFRFFFVVVSFVGSIWFYQTLKPYPLFHWAMEQKWMAILLPLLLLYNNPLFPLVFLTSGSFASVFDGFFQSTFLCALMIFWLCIYHGIRQSTRYFLTFYLPKILIVGSLWLSIVVLTVWDRINERSDPSWYSYDLDKNNFKGFKIFFFFTGGLYLAYLAFLLVRAYGELRNLPYFDLRLKFFTFLMVLVILVTIILTASKFGVAPSLEDNFVADLSTQYKTSVEFMAIYALLNSYMITMAFVYSPCSKSASDIYFKDTPGATLLNDSEDDMIYSQSQFNGLNQEPRRLSTESDL